MSGDEALPSLMGGWGVNTTHSITLDFSGIAPSGTPLTTTANDQERIINDAAEFNFKSWKGPRRPNAIWWMRRKVLSGGTSFQPLKQSKMPNLNGKECVALALRARGYGIKAIGKRIGVHYGTVRHFLFRNGLPLRIKECDRAISHRDASVTLWGGYVDAEIAEQEKHERRCDAWMLRAYSKNKLIRAMSVGKPHGSRNPKAAAIMRKRYQSSKHDPLFRMVRNVRTRVAIGIKRQGLIKDSRTLALLGCSWDEYMTHIFNQLTLGMTWENFGAWHIDHIVPINTFDLSCSIQRAQAFHWSNTRPLWASENWERPKDGSDLTKKQRKVLRYTPPMPVHEGFQRRLRDAG